MSSTGQPLGLQPDPSDQQPILPSQREASKNFTRASINVQSMITRTFTKASTNLSKAQMFVDHPLATSDNRTLNQVDGLRKELMTILPMIETDHHFFNVIEKQEWILSPSERSSLRDMVIQKFIGKPRENTVTQIKEAIVKLGHILDYNVYAFDTELSPQERQNISDNMSREQDDEVNLNRSFASNQEPRVLETHGTVNHGHVTNPVMSNTEFDGANFAEQIPRNEQHQYEASRQTVQRDLTYEPDQRSFLAQHVPCPACGNGHSLLRCDVDQLRKVYCAFNELCILCTSPRHKTFECPIRYLESSPAQTGGRLMTQDKTEGQFTPRIKPKCDTKHIAGTSQSPRKIQNYFTDSEEDEWQNPEEEELRQNLSIKDVNSILPKFNGDPLQYKKFMSRYRDLVLKNPRFKTVMKLTILEGKLEGAAKSFLVELENPRNAIVETLESLRTAYEEDVTPVSEVLKRIRDFQFHASNYNKMATEILDCKALIMRLRDYGEDVESRTFVRTLVEKFPEPVWKKLRPVYAKTNQPKTNEVLEVFEEYVKDRKFGDRFRQMKSEDTVMHTATPSTNPPSLRKRKPRNKLRSYKKKLDALNKQMAEQAYCANNGVTDHTDPFHRQGFGYCPPNGNNSSKGNQSERRPNSKPFFRRPFGGSD